MDWDWPRAESLYQRALAVNPNSALVRDEYAVQYLSPLGRHEEAIAEAKRAVELDPNNGAYHHALASIYAHSGDTRAAIVAVRKAIELAPAISILILT